MKARETDVKVSINEPTPVPRAEAEDVASADARAIDDTPTAETIPAIRVGLNFVLVFMCIV